MLVTANPAPLLSLILIKEWETGAKVLSISTPLGEPRVITYNIAY